MLAQKIDNKLSEFSDDFLAELKEDLVCRRIGRGMARLQGHQHLLTSFDPKQKNAAVFTGYLAPNGWMSGSDDSYHQ